MREQHPWPAQLVALLFVVASIAACDSEEDASYPQMVTSKDGSDALWYIKVSDARYDRTGSCLNSPTVAESWESSGPAGATLTIVLIPDATEADATRISDCLRTACPGEQVTVTRPG